MRLLKVSDGRIEIDNFYLYSDIADYAGSSVATKDVINNKVNLISNTYLERKFAYSSCVIDIQKENWLSYKDNLEYVAAYLGTANGIYGIKDNRQGENEYWRLLLTDGYIQVYCSADGKNWTNKGGTHISDPIISQGFKKNGDKPFTLKEYVVYKSAYITIQNFPEGTIVKLKDLEGNILKTRLFNADMEAQIILDDNVLGGELEFTDPTDTHVLFNSGPMTLQFGDTYILSPYDLEIIYKGLIVNIPTMLDSLCELVTIKNTSTIDVYNELKVAISAFTKDLIQLSLDGGSTFQDNLTLPPLGPGESIDVIIKVTRSIDTNDFMVRDFQLLVE